MAVSINGGNVVFRLVNENTDKTITDQWGNPRKFPRESSIVHECEILDKNGDIRVIRLLARQTSIYKDKQNVDESFNTIRSAIKPKFTNGYLIVPETDKRMLEFLRVHPNNVDNQGYNFPKQKSIFYEHKPQEIARKQNEEAVKQSRVTALVYTSDFKTKIVPLAKYLGFSTNKESDLVLWDIQNYAKANPTEFIQLIDEDFAVVKRFSEVCEAEDRGIIRVDSNSVRWGSDGRVIVNVPANYEAREYFTNMSFEKDMRTTWSHIAKLMNDQSSEDEGIMEDPAAEERGKYETMTYAELFDEARAQGQIRWEAPYFVFGEYKIKGKEKFVDKISSDDSLTNLIIASLV